MIVYTSDRKKIIIADDALASGGEGEVHIITSSPINSFSRHCVKLYYKNKRNPELRKKIEYMVANPPDHIIAPAFIICWPEATIFSKDGEFLGFIMPLAFNDSQSLVKLSALKMSKKMPDLWHQKFGHESGSYALINRLKLINNILVPVNLLHRTRRYVMQDFKPENVLVNDNGRISLLDMDSIQISHGNMNLKGGAATPEYIPPEFYSMPKGGMLQPSWDMFAVAVVFYKLLMGIHPYAVIPVNATEDDNCNISSNIKYNLFAFGENSLAVNYAPPHERFKNLPPQVRNLFKASFTNSPATRPSAETWLHELKKILGEIKKPPPPPPPPPPTPPPTPPTPPTPSGGLKVVLIVLVIVLLAVVAVVMSLM